MKSKLVQMGFLVLVSVAPNANSEKPIDVDVNEKANQNLPFMKIKNTYFTEVNIGTTKYRRLSIVMENSFRPCEETSPANTLQPWIEVREEDSGAAVFDMFSSVALASILADKRVIMVIDDTICYGISHRAKLNAINLIKN